MQNRKIDLTLVIITLNEENNIERCIKSVPFAREIIVVDSDSTDSTCSIAEKLGASIYRKEWEGFGAQKEYACSLASSKWILSLDADEWLTKELQAEVSDVVISGKYKICSMKRLSSYLGKNIYHGGWYPDVQTRLFVKEAACWNKNETIHESLKTSCPVKLLSGHLLHLPFNSIEDQIKTNMRYANLIADKKFREGKRIYSGLYIAINTVLRFIKNYIIKAGMADGLPGFIIAWNSAQSYLSQLYKIYEKSLKEKRDKENV